jgi:hypothetical protein
LTHPKRAPPSPKLRKGNLHRSRTEMLREAPVHPMAAAKLQRES